MYRRGALRISVLVLTVFLAVAPAFASPRNDSPTGPIERIILKLKKIFMPVVTEDPILPHP
jgi:HAMP domain-containing protein